MSPERAEQIAILALSWLGQNEELFPVFLGASGANADELREQAENPAFLAAVLDFLTMDDTWVVEFCDVHHLKYEEPLTARYALPGAEAVHWT
ncbi:DUF3572 domain-containing protein [Octadecabacter sp. CECT 8868]|uniref:DUF3572 domain-containing protein n=1 Tax=Octadecabacter algicola TaxID=2909342 RepID=UPI001F3F431A|nr:DUF3572 domain-containing protein [Octadecabacter algicola]MCF2904585.1 DUF3572 domain-containing protein [Octadecabacter algicola]